MEKLVRDKIPEIIAKENEQVCYRIIDKDCIDKDIFLMKKLKEETYELYDALNDNKLFHNKIYNEFADLLEVLETIKKHWNLKNSLIKKTKRKKRHERGSFDKFIILKVKKTNGSSRRQN